MALNPNRVLKPARKIRKLLKKMPKQPTPEQVHDLRTNTRRFEAVLAAISPQSLKRSKSLMQDLAAIRKKAGRVRDMDVLTSYVADLKVDGEEDCRVLLLQHLGAERKRDAQKLHRVVVKHADDTRHGLKRAATRLEKTLCADGSKDCDPAEAPAQTTASALKLESKLFDPPRLSKANLHPYRLKVKELHNVLRTGENRANHDFVQELSSVKDAIGEWHDWEELLAIAKDALDHPNCKLMRQLKTTADRKYVEALTHAERMRKKYLRFDRGKKRGSNSNGVPEPAWTATSALAA